MAARRSRPATGASCARAWPTRTFLGDRSRGAAGRQDKSCKPLDQRLEKLDRVVFHEKLGTQGERIKRIEALARELAPKVGADPELAARAAHLAKADLATEMVGEFPEFQGLMGRYYASAQGEEASVAEAIEDHYKPQGPNDRMPNAPVSIAVALADKLDTLVGFWAIDEKPTGSKDPYALRRAALGVIRIVLENELRLPLMRFSFRQVRVFGATSRGLLTHCERAHDKRLTRQEPFDNFRSARRLPESALLRTRDDDRALQTKTSSPSSPSA